jgi:hypothetical protein
MMKYWHKVILYISVANDSLVTTVKLKAKENLHMTDMLLFYILQKKLP